MRGQARGVDRGYDPAAGDAQRPPHATLQDSYMSDARLCGTCHDVTTPRERVDARGIGMGVRFNEQRTYSEWLGSDFARPGPDYRSCQDCHMPALRDAAGCLKFYENDPPTMHATGARTHDLARCG